MPRLTKADIESGLLSGKEISWKDANGKRASIILELPKQRSLFAYLLRSRVRDVKGLPPSFIQGLSSAYKAAEDPADAVAASSAQLGSNGPWKIMAISVEGFGGVNSWKGRPFELSLGGESLLIEGPNGSGKSSLTAAIIWGLTGERPRDYDRGGAETARPVFGLDDKEAGSWPPLATYPAAAGELKSDPLVRVEITLADPAANIITVKRTFDGKSTKVESPITIPSILLEAGLLMPARLPHLRLDEGRGRLTDAVQKLTGLDELIDVSGLVQGLCHKGREYQSYKTAELAKARSEFGAKLQEARTVLKPVSVSVPAFKPSDTRDTNGAMATLGKTLNKKAADLTKVVTNDLAAGLDLANAEVQKRIGIALVQAADEVAAGLGALTAWTSARAINSAIGSNARIELRKTIAEAQVSLKLALAAHAKSEADSRYRLKAAAAQWHAEHVGTGLIEACPLCEQSLNNIPALRAELNELQTDGETATRRLSDNVNEINVRLESSLAPAMRRYLSEAPELKPRAAILAEIEAKFVTGDRYKNYLAGCAEIVRQAFQDAPPMELPERKWPEAQSSSVASVVHRIAAVATLCEISEWFEGQEPLWMEWWARLTKGTGTPPVGLGGGEPLEAHLERITGSITEAEPYRAAAEAMRGAWQQGRIAADIEEERDHRAEIAEALAPLKALGNLAEAQARTAISELSARIAQIHGESYISDALRFQAATLDKKTGLVVRGKFTDDVRIDATLVANTSWLRGALWAFIFALRQEAVEQLGGDNFPVMVLDDPQQTFDSEHRHRWAERIAHLQKSAPCVQVILTTHEELFLSFLSIDGVSGRHAMISSAGAELGHVGLFEGDALDRAWITACKSKTPKDGRDYMSAVRVYVEGMLKLMLRGEELDVGGSVVGSCREKIAWLHNGKHEPWSRKVFEALAGKLGKGVPAIKYMETAHHSDGAYLGMAEAIDVESYWKKGLRPVLERAFRVVREHRALHGGLTALHAMTPTATLPDGHKSAIQAIPLPLIGTAAALTNGRAADGCLDFSIDDGAKDIVELKDHLVFRSTVPTLEPVARPGDLLVVSEHAPPTAKSLVVALNDDRLLARRLEVADNHSDVAVLTANAINPRLIAAPVVAKLSTLSLRKIVGILFARDKFVAGSSGEMEICDCGGESIIKAGLSKAKGLVAVVGHSAEPHALDKQFLIVGDTITLDEATKEWEGRPVIAEDGSGGRYFKRFRPDGDWVILESLEIGGDFAPIVLSAKGTSVKNIQTIWPVFGVLFERPK